MKKDLLRVMYSVEIHPFCQLSKTGLEPMVPRLLGRLTVSVKAGQKVVKKSELIHTVQLHVLVKLLKKPTAPG